MQLDLSGKRVLVTGSSRGIGKVIAEVLHSEGCRVALNARGKDDLMRAVTAVPGSAAIAGDVSEPDEAVRVVAEAVATLGGLDILVCNVGSGRSVAPGNETHAEWNRVLAINLLSATSCVQAARKALAGSGGAVVCVSSICGLEVVPGAPVTYSVAKAGLHAYVRGIALPLGKEGIRINAVAAGNILFDGSVWSQKLAQDASAVSAMLERDVALKRLGAPHDVAQLVAYLASPRAGFATGGVWTLDGGQVRS